MDKFTDLGVSVPQGSRDSINKKILSLIDCSDMQGITGEDIFNTYTGIGGLHGLNRGDFNSYYDYAEAKKNIEAGQFFTPHSVCKSVSELVKPTDSDLVADITCGIGNFFNYFQEENCYGCEIDINAYKVSKHLYPKATILNDDFRFYSVDTKVDYVLGNPPFNLRIRHPKTGNTLASQFYFFEKSAEILKPGGIVLAVVPTSFLKDAFSNKSNIEDISGKFSFVGQYKLEDDAFESMGVQKFETKVVCFQRVADSIATRPYFADEFVSYDELKIRIGKLIEGKAELKLKLRQELLQGDEDTVFTYKLNKYLFEINTHEELKKHYNKALAYLQKFKTQKCPEGEDYEYWYKHNRITKDKVLSYMKRTVSKQNVKPKKDVNAYVLSNGAIKLKSYSRKAKLFLKKDQRTYWDINHLVTGVAEIPTDLPIGLKRLIYKKRKAYKSQDVSFSDMGLDPKIANFLRRFYFIDKEDKVCQFNKIQRHDLNLQMQKHYGILAWQMGGGKTAGSYAYSRFVDKKNTIIISTSLAINLTWKPFLLKNRERITIIKTEADVNNIKDGDYILLSFHYINKQRRALKNFMKRNNNNVTLIFDESDEITNNRSNKTRAVLDIFRRSRRKLLTTGTTTRNNIGELYSQLELLYNNSYNMMSFSPMYYVEEKKKGKETAIVPKQNKYYLQPFPAHYGQTTFTRCFNPAKSTVFGIKKQNQDIYNKEDLTKIIAKTIITRKFREIAGDKYNVKNVQVSQDYEEREVYKTIIKELDSILPDYYSTGNSRKDSLLKILRQLTLLIEATSTPQLFPFYTGKGIPQKAIKIKKMIGGIDDKVSVGCTTKKGARWYKEYLQDEFPDREVFFITGDVNINKRNTIIDKFEATEDGIIVSTQQSLKSSVNIPTCDNVIIESLQWNIPKIEQFYFRFIRYNSINKTNVFFVNYDKTIEINLLALLMAKEKLNDYVKTLDYKDNSDIYSEYDIDVDILDGLITKEKDHEGKVQIKWGETKTFD